MGNYHPSKTSTLDEANVMNYADSNNISYDTFADLIAHPDIKELIDSEVEKKNKELLPMDITFNSSLTDHIFSIVIRLWPRLLETQSR